MDVALSGGDCTSPVALVTIVTDTVAGIAMLCTDNGLWNWVKAAI